MESKCYSQGSEIVNSVSFKYIIKYMASVNLSANQTEQIFKYQFDGKNADINTPLVTAITEEEKYLLIYIPLINLSMEPVESENLEIYVYFLSCKVNFLFSIYRNILICVKSGNLYPEISKIALCATIGCISWGHAIV